MALVEEVCQLVRSFGGQATAGQKLSLKEAPDASGPRGGNTKAVYGGEERRQASLNAPLLPSGARKLHRYEDTANPGIKNEQPWHRMVALLLLSGVDQGTIARQADCTPGYISDLKAQRWFQELLAELSNDQANGLLGFIRGEAVASIQKIVAIRDDPDAPASVSLRAAQDLVDRAEGKAIQRVVTSTHHTFATPEEEMRELQRELATLENSPTT